MHPIFSEAQGEKGGYKCTSTCKAVKGSYNWFFKRTLNLPGHYKSPLLVQLASQYLVGEADEVCGASPLNCPKTFKTDSKQNKNTVQTSSSWLYISFILQTLSSYFPHLDMSMAPLAKPFCKPHGSNREESMRVTWFSLLQSQVQAPVTYKYPPMPLFNFLPTSLPFYSTTTTTTIMTTNNCQLGTATTRTYPYWSNGTWVVSPRQYVPVSCCIQ